MTKDILSVFPAGVSRSIQQLQQTVAEIQAGFASLRGDGEAVITGSWTGSAANAVDRPWQQWESDFGKHVGHVDQFPEFLAAVVRAFESLDAPGTR